MNNNTMQTQSNQSWEATTLWGTSGPPQHEVHELNTIEILRIFLSCLGLVGNTISFIVFSRKAFSHLSVSVFLRILSVLDNCVIIVYNIVSLYHAYTTPTVATVEDAQLPKAGAWFIASLATASAWILVLVSIERVSAVCIPIHVSLIFTKKRAILSGLGVIPLSFASHLYIILLKPAPHDAWPMPIIFAILYSGVPSIVLITANAIVLSAMYRRRGLLRNNRERRGISSMLIVSCLVFVVLTISFPIYEVCTQNAENQPYIRSTLIVITGVNHCVNFIFYGLSGSLFRRELMIMFCSRCVKFPRRSSTFTTNTPSSPTSPTSPSANGLFSDGRGRFNRGDSVSTVSTNGTGDRNTIRDSQAELYI